MSEYDAASNPGSDAGRQSRALSSYMPPLFLHPPQSSARADATPAVVNTATTAMMSKRLIYLLRLLNTEYTDRKSMHLKYARMDALGVRVHFPTNQNNSAVVVFPQLNEIVL